VRPEGLGKFKNSPHRVSNPLPSGLQHSALTSSLPRAYMYHNILPCNNISGLTSNYSNENVEILPEFVSNVSMFQLPLLSRI
jgi:hypothetical protein